jgi:hypothetical protein
MKRILLVAGILAISTAAQGQTLLARQPVPAKVFVQAVGWDDEFEGQLIARDATSVTLKVDRLTYTLPLSRVTKIELQKGRRTGFGAITGGLIGVLAGALCFYCEQGRNGDGPDFAVVYGLEGAMIGSIVGFFRHDRQTIYPDAFRPPK